MAGEKFGREAGVLALSPRRITIQSLFRAGLFQGEILFRVGLFRGRLCSGWAGGRIEKPSPAAGEIIQNRNTPSIVPGSRPDCSRVVEQRKPLILADCSICSMCSIFSLWSRWKYANRGVVQEIAHIYGASRRSTPHPEQPGTAFWQVPHSAASSTPGGASQASPKARAEVHQPSISKSTTCRHCWAPAR